MSIVGVDLAGVETRPTGFCVFANMNVSTCILYTDKEILQRIAKIEPRLIAIDAPLCLPPGRKSIEERTSVHLRECDIALLKIGIKIFPITLGPMRKLTLRGIGLRENFERKGFRVIEAYPGGAQDVLAFLESKKDLTNYELA